MHSSYRRKIILALALLSLPGLANAHAILTDSTPKAGGSVSAGPLDVRLRYNSRIDAARSRLTLIRPDHASSTLPIAADHSPDTIGCHLQLTPGAYSIRWQVLATDGHITRGDVPFTVTGP